MDSKKMELPRFNPWLSAFISMQRLEIAPQALRIREVALFCFRFDVDMYVESPCDRQIIKDVMNLIRLTPGSKEYIDDLSSIEVPYPSEVLKWKERNEKRSTELEKLCKEYMTAILIKIKQ